MTAAALALLASPASAQQHEAAGRKGPLAKSCWGTKVETKVLRDHLTNRRIGRVELWYSPSNRGTNCVITYNEVPGRALTYAYLIVDDNRNRDNKGRKEKGDRVAYDQDNYQYYAGASYLRRTNGKCVQFGGSVTARQGHDGFGSRWVHCR